MALVTGDDRTRRIGPKVFADVPSAAEVTSIKRSRSQWFIISVLLLGIAAGLGFVIWSNMNSQTGVVAENRALTEQVAQRDRVIAQMTEEASDLQRFREINALRAQAETLRTDIAGRIRQRPGAAVRARGTVYETPPRWPAISESALTQLQDEVNGRNGRPGLVEVRRRVFDWEQAPVAGPPEL